MELTIKTPPAGVGITGLMDLLDRCLPPHTIISRMLGRTVNRIVTTSTVSNGIQIQGSMMKTVLTFITTFVKRRRSVQLRKWWRRTHSAASATQARQATRVVRVHCVRVVTHTTMSVCVQRAKGALRVLHVVRDRIQTQVNVNYVPWAKLSLIHI